MKASLIKAIFLASVWMLNIGISQEVPIIKNENGPINSIELENVSGLFYTVQIGVFSKPIAESSWPNDASPLYFDQRLDGSYVYCVGLFDCRFEALMKRYDMVNGGIYDAFIAVYYNGSVISMNDADNLLAEKGKSILYSSSANKPVDDLVAK